MSTALDRPDFGHVLRTWRGRRNQSQLGLANEAGVSQRHISFLETGKANPSREMVVHLGVVLEVPLRERNSMLVTAGFAPVYQERSIDDPDLAEIRQALEAMLSAHDPFPAYVVNRRWDLLLANDASSRLMEMFSDASAEVFTNIARLVMHPDGLRTVSSNWSQVAAALLRRIEREFEENPADTDLSDLLAEVRTYPDLPADTDVLEVPAAHELLIPLRMASGDIELSFFTAISTLMGPCDVTLDELRLETLLPADAITRQALVSNS